MMPYDWRWSSLQFTGQADFWHPTSTAVREWAKAQGIEVKDRGRVPAELVARFKAATGQ
jgi:Lsr2 protein